MDQLPSKLPFSKKRLRARVVISYIFDYVIIIALVIGFYILDAVEPYHQHFSLNNISLQYPYAVHETVTIGQAVALSCGLPVVVILIHTLFIDGLFSHHKPSKGKMSGRRKLSGTYRWKDRLWELNCGILGLLLSQGLAFVITQVLKNACGKPRPDIIDRCNPDPFAQDQKPAGLSNYTICRQPDHAILKDGFRSWPSGHSSSSFAGLFYLSLYLCGKLHVMDNRGEVWKTILIMIPCLVATLIAVSRIMDARHHPFDVITGSLLGVFTAWASYRQYFPPITEPWKKGRAYPIRTWGTEPRAPAGAPPLEGFNESSVALRNPDEERIDVPGGTELRRTSSPPPPPRPTVSPRPYESNVYARQRRDPDENYSSSSSEDVTDGYEMRGPYVRTQNSEWNSQYPGYTYESDTAYHLPGRPTQGAPISEVQRPLTTAQPHGA